MKYEYFEMWMNSTDRHNPTNDAQMSEAGLMGWELVNVLVVDKQFVAFFKRRIKE